MLFFLRFFFKVSKFDELEIQFENEDPFNGGCVNRIGSGKLGLLALKSKSVKTGENTPANPKQWWMNSWFSILKHSTDIEIAGTYLILFAL